LISSLAGRCWSEAERRIVDNFLHDEECSSLPDAWQSYQRLGMQSVEIDHAYTDFEEVIELASYDMAIENHWHVSNGRFESAEALGRGAVKHDSDEGERAPVDAMWRDLRTDRTDISFRDQPLDPAMARCRTGIYPFCYFSVAEPSISLQQPQDFQISPVERRSVVGSFISTPIIER
jgi:hypothetical protein